MILAHMVEDDDTWAMQIRANRHGVLAEAGEYGMARQGHVEQAIQHNGPAGEVGRPLVSFRVGLEGVRWCRPL